MLTSERGLDAAPVAWGRERPDPSVGQGPCGQFEQLAIPMDGFASSEFAPPSSGKHVNPGRTALSVAAFHRAFNLPWKRRPGVDGVSDKLLRLREDLLEEEATEFVLASHKRDLIGMADALADIVYVAYGTAVTLGLDLDALLDEVHRSNMSKLDAKGRPVLRFDGKVLKSPRYRPPDIERVIAEQPPLPF